MVKPDPKNKRYSMTTQSAYHRKVTDPQVQADAIKDFLIGKGISVAKAGPIESAVSEGDLDTAKDLGLLLFEKTSVDLDNFRDLLFSPNQPWREDSGVETVTLVAAA
jgi:hypothetical protein